MRSVCRSMIRGSCRCGQGFWRGDGGCPARGGRGDRPAAVVDRRIPAVLVLGLPALLVTGTIMSPPTIQPLLPTLLGAEALARLTPTRRLRSSARSVFSSAAPGRRRTRLPGGCDAGLPGIPPGPSRRGCAPGLALIVAAFGQVHFAIHPGTYGTLITTGDLLRVAFYGLMLVALAVESREDLRALRRANEELVHLREADLARATAEERARLAREIHDGMSQELWYAKLKQGRLLLRDRAWREEARRLASEVATAIESARPRHDRRSWPCARPKGRASPRSSSATWRISRTGSGSPADCAPTRLRSSSPGAQAELLRIVQEALNNVRKHADADPGPRRDVSRNAGLRVTIADNGRGFRADEPSSGLWFGRHARAGSADRGQAAGRVPAAGGTRVVGRAADPRRGA